MLRPGILTTFHLPVQDHSYPALPLAGITVYPLTVIICVFPYWMQKNLIGELPHPLVHGLLDQSPPLEGHLPSMAM
jgi:hypothetical protein